MTRARATQAGHRPGLPRTLSRRGVLAGACLLPFASRAARAGARDWPFFINVNLQGLEGGSVLPGRAGTDYFVAAPAEVADAMGRTTGPARVPFRWERLQPRIGDALDPTYLGELQAVAAAAARVGRAVILDCHSYMHRLVDGQNRAVDGADGTLTRHHLADLWTRLATALAGHPGVAGWDLMNEPQGLDDGQDLAAIMQACVDAIDRVDQRGFIYVEGDNWSSAERWTAVNPGYPLTDRFDRLVYSAHCYADSDRSGTHFDYADLDRHGIPSGVLVDRTAAFARWCADHGLRGHIGETNVGTDDPRWNDVLRQGLSFWKSQNLPVNLWMYGANFGPNPFNLYPAPGQMPPQWGVIRAVLSS